MKLYRTVAWFTTNFIKNITTIPQQFNRSYRGKKIEYMKINKQSPGGKCCNRKERNVASEFIFEHGYKINRAFVNISKSSKMASDSGN